MSKHKIDEDFKLKDYRNIVPERNSVQAILDITYKNIDQFAKIESQTVGKGTVSSLVTSFATHKLDIFDKSLLDFCNSYGIHNIITDDRDYRTVSDEINIYTANRHYFSTEKSD